MEKNAIKITENLKRMIINEHPYAISKGADGRWRTYVKEDEVEKGRRMIVNTRKEDLLDAVACYYVLSGNERYLRRCVSIRTLFPEWLEYKALHTNADTYITRIMSEWARYYENDPIVDRPIYLLKKIELDKWAHRKIKEYDMTKNMYHNFAVIIRQCLQYAVDMEIVGTNEFEQVYIDGRRMFRKTVKQPDWTQVYTRNEVKALFGAAWNDFLHSEKLEYRLAPLALMFQFLTGLRVGELCAVKYSDIQNAEIHICRMLRRDSGKVVEHTKTHNDRVVILPDSAIELIDIAKSYQARNGIDTEFVFSTSSSPLKYNEVNILLRRYCTRLDIPYRSSHKARKTYISALIDAGVNINTVRAMAGHADERTTYHNYCFDRSTNEQKKKLIERALSQVF